MALTYEPIATTTLTSDQSGGIVFSSIPSTYTDLVLIINGISPATGGGVPTIRINGDTGTNYGYYLLQATTNNITTNKSGATAKLFLGTQNYPSSGSSNRSFIKVNFLSYASTSKFKSIFAEEASENGSNIGDSITSAIWTSTSAITSITITNDGIYGMGNGSSATLYGIKAA